MRASQLISRAHHPYPFPSAHTFAFAFPPTPTSTEISFFHPFLLLPFFLFALVVARSLFIICLLFDAAALGRRHASLELYARLVAMEKLRGEGRHEKIDEGNGATVKTPSPSICESSKRERARWQRARERDRSVARLLWVLCRWRYASADAGPTPGVSSNGELFDPVYKNLPPTIDNIPGSDFVQKFHFHMHQIPFHCHCILIIIIIAVLQWHIVSYDVRITTSIVK